MPARWVVLLSRVAAACDQASADLSPPDLVMFDDALHAFTQRRMAQRGRTPWHHPPAQHPLFPVRDPTGEHPHFDEK